MYKRQLTYSTMLAIVPLIMVVFSIFSAFPVFNEVTGADVYKRQAKYIDIKNEILALESKQNEINAEIQQAENEKNFVKNNRTFAWMDEFFSPCRTNRRYWDPRY